MKSQFETSDQWYSWTAIMLAALAVWTCLMLVGCVRPLPPPAPPPPAYYDAGAGDGPPSCLSACLNIFALGCPDKSTQCVPACENVQASGVFSYDVACITAATSCAAVAACMQVEPK